MSEQLELQMQPVPDVSEVEQFRGLLKRCGWLTRREVVRLTGWSDRRVRAVAEAMGAEVVRGQKGFKLLANIDPRVEIGAVLQAGQAAISQAKKGMRYGVAMIRAAHALMKG